jgi:hypothetical protein
MSQRVGNWNLTSGMLYGRIPARSAGGTRVSLSGTTATSAKLKPGFYELYGLKSSSSGLMVFVADGVSTVTANTKCYMVPADQSRFMEVKGGENDYVAGICYSARVGTLCIYRVY